MNYDTYQYFKCINVNKNCIGVIKIENIDKAWQSASKDLRLLIYDIISISQAEYEETKLNFTNIINGWYC